MKKKEAGCKVGKSKSSDSSIKKSQVKTKSKSHQTKKQQSPLIFLVGDSFYLASSKTERRNYEQFERKVKNESTQLKKVKLQSKSNFNQTINLQEYVKTLSKEEKARLINQLAQDIQPSRQVEELRSDEEEDKLLRLREKLESIKDSLLTRWDQQISKVNLQFETQQISLEEKNEKINVIQKIKNSKIAMIKQTQRLFQKILKQDPDLELEKSERVEHILTSLTSFSPDQYQEQIDVGASSFDNRLSKKSEQSPKREWQELELDQGQSSKIKIEDNSKSDTLIISKDHLRLDIRLDEVEFGKDHYDDENVSSPPPQKKEDQALRLEFGQKKTNLNYTSEKISQKKNQKGSLDNQFLCVGQESHILIPLLMTKDRIQQIQIQKSAKQIEILNQKIQARQSFQNCDVISNQKTYHFTTLIDVNQFLVQFYQYIMKYHMDKIIEGMNSAFGKSCIDKLYILRVEGHVPDQSTKVLYEVFFEQFIQLLSKIRKVNQEQKLHNFALFQAFNSALDVYRPYYQLEGEVFPWNASQKNLTFYEISDQNIEEVFQKSKLKVIESCASLCGLIPDCQITTPQAIKILTKRNQDCCEKMLRAEMIEKFGEWNIKKINFEALFRNQLCEEIFQDIIEGICIELIEY